MATMQHPGAPPLAVSAPHRALLVSRHPATMNDVGQVLGALGYAYEAHPHVDAAAQAGLAQAALVLLDLDEETARDPFELVQGLTERFPQTPLVALAGPDARRRLLRAFSHPAVVHLAPKLPLPRFGDEPLCFAGPDTRFLFVALRLGRERELPRRQGAGPYLAQGTALHEAWVGDPARKDAAVTEILALAEGMRLREEMQRRIETLADEIIENALYDAPCDSAGRSRYAQLDRRLPAFLEPHEEVRVQFGCDGATFVIAVADPFGTLTHASLVEHLGKLLHPERLRVAPGPGGSGLGLITCYQAANLLAFRVHPRVATEVTAVVDLRGGNRASLERGTSIHSYLSSSGDVRAGSNERER